MALAQRSAFALAFFFMWMPLLACPALTVIAVYVYFQGPVSGPPPLRVDMVIIVLVLLIPVQAFLILTTDTVKKPIARVMFVVSLLSASVLIIMWFAFRYRVLGVHDGEVPTNDPFTCLYFSIVTWTTLGYGDVRPSVDARMLAASEAVLGYIWMAGLIGLFSFFFRDVFEERSVKRGEAESKTTR